MSGVRIKVCGVTRVDDAAVAARADVDAVGFVLWPGSPRAVSLDQAARLGQALPPWTVRVGVFVSVSVDAVAAAVAAAGLGAVQLHGVADPTRTCVSPCRCCGRCRCATAIPIRRRPPAPR